MRAFLPMLVAGSLAAGPVWAQEPESEITSHQKQFGLSARMGVGVRAIATYEKTTFCGDGDTEFKRVCTGRAPLSLDIEAAYGIARSIELLLELRIGIESDFGSGPGADGPRPFHISPGARFFFSESGRTKLFVQPQIVFDFASYEQASGNDFGVRGIEGVWIDLHRSYGLYFYIAETIEFSRWLSGGFELGVGFQGRYP